MEAAADSGRKKRGYGKRCMAMHCRKTYKDGVSIFAFPFKRPEILEQWIDFVISDRGGWGTRMPTKYSHLCEDHFTESCFPLWYRLYGKPTSHKRLLEDAVPTLHKNESGQIHMKRYHGYYAPRYMYREINCTPIMVR